jgi:tRNA pseudouridine38-40 synthase
MQADSPARRWKCVCAYDGGGFAGWQSQKGGRGVQDAIEARLAAMTGGPVRVHGSGRTDAGAHALGQVFHFDAPWRHGPERLAAALRAGLPAAIQIKSVRPASRAFHARFSAAGKTYVYDLFLGDPDPFRRPYCWAIRRPLDLAAMEAAAGVLRGRHDFTAFSAARSAGDGDGVRNLRRLAIARRGRGLRVTAEADGFLYKMVRRIVGALVAVGEGKLAAGRLREILEARSRTALMETAPPQGLFLQRVSYRRQK